MQKRINLLTCVLLAGIVLIGCKKSEPTSYELGDMVYVYKDPNNTKKDSTTYSFAVKPNSLTVDTVKIPVRIMGIAKGYDREVKLIAVDTASTAVEGVHYDFLPYKIPAGAYSALLPVVIKRTPDMKTQSFTLMVKIVESKDFLPGVANSPAAGSFGGASTHYPIRINDFLTKPSNWDAQLIPHFGAFSQVKYQFIIAATGITDFTVGNTPLMSYGEIVYHKAFVKSKLVDYVAANGPLIDELGAVVTFP